MNHSKFILAISICPLSSLLYPIAIELVVALLIGRTPPFMAAGLMVFQNPEHLEWMAPVLLLPLLLTSKEKLLSNVLSIHSLKGFGALLYYCSGYSYCKIVTKSLMMAIMDWVSFSSWSSLTLMSQGEHYELIKWWLQKHHCSPGELKQNRDNLLSTKVLFSTLCQILYTLLRFVITFTLYTEPSYW